jgi:hypothetical protein
MGMTQMAMSLAFAIGPWAGTAVLDAFGGKALWLSVLGIGLVSTAMMLRMPDDGPALAAPVAKTV